MGGTDNKENLVELLPEEHFVAHQLLHKIYPERKDLLYAANMMNNTSKITNKKYSWLKLKWASMRTTYIDLDWLQEELLSNTIAEIARNSIYSHELLRTRVKQYSLYNPNHAIIRAESRKKGAYKSNKDIDLDWLQEELLQNSLGNISRKFNIDYEFLRYRVNKYNLKNPHKRKG
jgi:hypothetical protein